MKMIKTNNLKLCYDEKIILDDINIEIEKGKITALIGPNGCGKSTLIKSISKILTPKSGEVLMGDKNLLKMPPKELAKELAMLPQSSSAPEDLTIYDLVKQGRYPYHPHLSGFQYPVSHTGRFRYPYFISKCFWYSGIFASLFPTCHRNSAT